MKSGQLDQPKFRAESLEVTIKGNKRFSGWSPVAGDSNTTQALRGIQGSTLRLAVRPSLDSRRLIPPEVFSFQYENLGWDEGWHRAVLHHCLGRLGSDARLAGRG